MDTVAKIVQTMEDAGKTDYALMHCVSAYPTLPGDCNLQLIRVFKGRFPNVTIGYSGHELGILLTQAAVLLGARIVERHFTLDKNQKGSDHRCSLEPNELRVLIEQIKQFDLTNDPFSVWDVMQKLNGGQDLANALHDVLEKEILPCELPCRNKLGKSIVAARSLPKGHILAPSDMAIKVSQPSGETAEKYFDLIGKELIVNVGEDEPITGSMLFI